MKKPSAGIKPQRYIQGKGWQDCEPHQARRWACFIGARMVGWTDAKWKAEEMLATAFLRSTKRSKRPQVYAFGARMQARPEHKPVIARSLTTEEYNNRD